MTENLEITAKTVEEATRKALVQLGVGLDDLEIIVINQGRSGILGLGAEDARIRVTVRESKEPEGNRDIEAARKILEELLLKMGVRATVKVEAPGEITDEDGETSPVILNVENGDLGILIGRRGQTIDALQYLLRLILTRQLKSKIPVMVDVEGYKQRRYEDLRTLALNVAEQVKDRRASIRLEPMPPFERRIIHTALAKDQDVITESMGEGDNRKVVVRPKLKER
jgi:spoIIIJ-associated protein